MGFLPIKMKHIELFQIFSTLLYAYLRFSTQKPPVLSLFSRLSYAYSILIYSFQVFFLFSQVIQGKVTVKIIIISQFNFHLR